MLSLKNELTRNCRGIDAANERFGGCVNSPLKGGELTTPPSRRFSGSFARINAVVLTHLAETRHFLGKNVGQGIAAELTQTPKCGPRIDAGIDAELPRFDAAGAAT